MSHDIDPFRVPGCFAPSARTSAALSEAGRAREALAARLRELMEAVLDEKEWTLLVRVAIDAAFLTEADIATGLEISRSTVNRWRTGVVHPPRSNMAALGSKLMRLVDDKWKPRSVESSLAEPCDR